MIDVDRVATDLPRTIVVSPPAQRAETANVARAVFLIAFWSVVVIHLVDRSRARAGAAEAPDPPFVARFQALDPTAQRTYRALSEGLVEAERARERGGTWPSAATLAGELIPPFAPDPLDRAGYRWTSFVDGRVVNYVGVPADTSTARTFVAIIVEPDPGQVDPAVTADELHHDVGGVIVHVGTFIGSGPGPTAAQPSVNFNEGWQQILVGPSSVIGR